MYKNENFYLSSTPVKLVVSLFITPIIREINQQASGYVSAKKRVRLHDHGWQTGEVDYDPDV